MKLELNMKYKLGTVCTVILFGICVSCSQPKKEKAIPVKKSAPDFEVEVETVRSGYVPDTMWTQAYIAATPVPDPQLILTLSQKLGTGIDNYGDLFYYKKNNGSWSGPDILMERRADENGVEKALSDLYPKLHRKTGKILGTGKMFFYDTSNEDDPEIGRGLGYTVFDPEANLWGEIKEFSMPERDHSDSTIYNISAGCNQRFDLPNGEILLPVYYLRKNTPEGNNLTTIVRCRFDGEKLEYLEHGNELTVYRDRGFGETSVTEFNGKYFITIRADHSAFVAMSDDGLNYSKPKEWKFDDGQILGSYNTQQHWVRHSEALFLVYTRKGANNDHIFRHRAPLFIGQVDPDKMVILKDTERELIPQRGARLGNFGVTEVDEYLTVVSTSERMTDISESYGADNSVFVSKIKWKTPNKVLD